MFGVGFRVILLILGGVIISVVFVLILYWRIFGKAGFSPALSLLMLLPLVNVVMLYYLAFGEWPSLKQDQK
jgi:hypothetical protein